MARTLKLYNSLTRRKEDFQPLEAGRVGLYVCGMTVYDYCHIGHARMLVAFDVVQRWLRARGYQVTYVRNITDIDDKIIRRAVENGETLSSLTGRFIAAMHEDEAALGIQRPDLEPRATDYVPQMLDLVGLLERNGYAYRSGDGDTLFRVRRFAGYGRLGGKSLDDLRAGERVAVAAGKEDPFDFVLWKAAKPEEPPEACWQGPFGPGRPGWHLECSAMSTQLLGRQFDIHGGGADLQFPHHENEIAQSDAAYFPEGGKSFVRYWLHNGFVQVDGEKMSKSLGNFFTIRDVLKKFDGEVIRFFIVRSHYRIIPMPGSMTPANRCCVSTTRSRPTGRPHRPRTIGPRARPGRVQQHRPGQARLPLPAAPTVTLPGLPWPPSTGPSRAPCALPRRWTTISTPRWPSRCCSSWPPISTAPVIPPSSVSCAAWPPCWGCWGRIRSQCAATDCAAQQLMRAISTIMRSRHWSTPDWLPARLGTSPRPTPSASSWPRPASPLKTVPPAPPGGVEGRTDIYEDNLSGF